MQYVKLGAASTVPVNPNSESVNTLPVNDNIAATALDTLKKYWYVPAALIVYFVFKK